MSQVALRLGARTRGCELREKKGSPKAPTGLNRTLSELEEQEIKHWIIGGDLRQYDFDFVFWTHQIIANLILGRFNIEFGLSGIGKIGLTPQKPLRRAYERDKKRLIKNGLPTLIQKLRNTH